jgi:hypothetical protein
MPSSAVTSLPDRIQHANAAIPFRFWWLKRVTAVVAAMIALAVGSRLWWGHSAHARLQAEIDRLIAKDEPILVDHFQYPSVHSDQNGALILTKAAQLWKPMASLQSADRAEYIRANAKPLELIRKARRFSLIDWGVRITSPSVATSLSYLGHQGELVDNICKLAGIQHELGLDGESVRSLNDAIFVSDSLERGPQFVITHLVRCGKDHRIAEAIERIAPNLEFTDEKRNAAGPPTRALKSQVRDLIDLLLNEDGHQKALLDSSKVERMGVLDTILCTLDPSKSGIPGFPNSMYADGVEASSWTLTELSPIGKPLIEADGFALLNYWTDVVGAARGRTWPVVVAALPAPAKLDTIWARKVFADWRPIHLFRYHFRALAKRRMAAIALAMRLFEVDRGRSPETLNELTPDYLPRVLRDPFAADGRTLSYLTNGCREIWTGATYGSDRIIKSYDTRAVRPQAVLYSVGLDGLAQHGTVSIHEDGTFSTVDPDIVFFLDGRPQFGEGEISGGSK